MDVLKTKSNEELLLSLLAETAKAQNELRCAKADIEKAQNRIRFVLVLTNELINRKED
jgi:hypothetical protein